MIKPYRFVLSTLLFGFIAGSNAFAADIALTGKGEATYSKKKEAMAAREHAIEEATKQAVRKSLSQYVKPDVLQQKADDVELFLETAVAMVKQTEVVKEEDLNGKYTVIVKAYVDEDTLKKNLDSSGFSMDVGSRRTVAVLIDEYYAGDAKPSTEPMVAEEINVSSVDYSRDASFDQKNDVQSAEASKYKEKSASSSASSSREAAAIATSRGAAAASSRSASASSESSSSSGSSSSSFNDKSSVSAKDSESFSAMNTSIKRYFPPEALKQPRPDPSSAESITKMLLGRDVRLVDNKVASEMRQAFVGEDGLFATGISDPAASAAKAAALGAKYSADAVMVGVTGIIYNGAENGTHKATATLALRVVDSVTGDIVASTVRSQSGRGPDSQAAANEAASRLGSLIGQDLGEQMFTYWKKRDEKGVEVTLRIVGVTSTQVKMAAESMIRTTKGTESVAERTFDRQNGILEFVVTTRRPLNEFKSDVLTSLYSKGEFQKLEEEMSMGSSWNFKLGN